MHAFILCNKYVQLDELDKGVYNGSQIASLERILLAITEID